MSEATARAENAVFGTGERLKQQALDLILLDTQGNEIITPRIYSMPSSPAASPLDDILHATEIE